MNAQPVRRYRKPKYPNRQEVLANPELLRQHVPARWKVIPEMASAMVVFLAANAGCVRENEKTLAIVAPIFEHGEGRGAAGCTVVAPPVFLSEQEAMQVIREELGKGGVKVSGTNTLAGVSVIKTVERYGKNGEVRVKRMGPGEPLKIFNLNTRKPAVVQIVTQKNYSALGGHISWSSSVWEYDTRRLAKSLREQVEKEAQEPVRLGFFYDPMVLDEREESDIYKNMAPQEIIDHIVKKEQAKRVESQRLLRLQVQDFVKWLEGQGAI